ncbi:MAG: DUF4931 domain-containing protein [Pirellula sp.]
MRYDWLTDRWVIFAPNRMVRPDDYVRGGGTQSLDSHEPCPFCAGAEHETPNATLLLPERDCDATTSTRQEDLRMQPREDWLVRVVPNRYPAVRMVNAMASVLQLAQLQAHGQGSIDDSASGHATLHATATFPSRNEQCDPHHVDLFVRREIHGAHEVIIESPSHIRSVTKLAPEHIEMVFEAYQKRLIHWRASSALKYAVVFKNYGADAGASLAHSHSQLIATDFVPCDIERMHQRVDQYHRSHERCYLCDTLEQELQHTERIVCESESFVALCPFASRFPFATQIMPRRHQSLYESCRLDEVRELASLVQRVLRAIEREHPEGSYNYMLHTLPFDSPCSDAFHWNMQIIPRLCKVAGFEWSSDCFINTVTPEDAAGRLRSHLRTMSSPSKAS